MQTTKKTIKENLLINLITKINMIIERSEKKIVTLKIIPRKMKKKI